MFEHCWQKIACICILSAKTIMQYSMLLLKIVTLRLCFGQQFYYQPPSDKSTTLTRLLKESDYGEDMGKRTICYLRKRMRMFGRVWWGLDTNG